MNVDYKNLNEFVSTDDVVQTSEYDIAYLEATAWISFVNAITTRCSIDETGPSRIAAAADKMMAELRSRFTAGLLNRSPADLHTISSPMEEPVLVQPIEEEEPFISLVSRTRYLLSLLADFKAVDRVGSFYTQFKNNAPAVLLEDAIMSLEYELNKLKAK